MKVQTIGYTPNPEELVVTAARGDYFDGFVGEASIEELMEDVEIDMEHVETLRSTPAPADKLHAKMYGFLERQIRHRHFGPFEHPQITFAVKGISRSCMAQITRHRHITFDVQSQRYVDFSEKDDRFAVPKSLTDENHATRHGSVDVDRREAWRIDTDNLADNLFYTYEKMVNDGVPKEDARFILPIGTKVNLTMSMNARTLLHLEEMRKKADAQWEIRQLTDKIHEEFSEWMPMSAHIYEEHGPFGIAP